MSPDAEALIRRFDRFLALFERVLDTRILDSHEKMKVEIIHLRNDTNGNTKEIEKLSASSEDTQRIFVHERDDKIKKYEESERHWTRYAVAAFVTLCFIGVSALLGYLAHR